MEELQLRITSIIKRPENAAFYQQILQYDVRSLVFFLILLLLILLIFIITILLSTFLSQPIDVAALQEILKAAGLRVNRVLLGQYLTSSGVAFSKMKTMNSLVDDRL